MGKLWTSTRQSLDLPQVPRKPRVPPLSQISSYCSQPGSTQQGEQDSPMPMAARTAGRQLSPRRSLCPAEGSSVKGRDVKWPRDNVCQQQPQACSHSVPARALASRHPSARERAGPGQHCWGPSSSGLVSQQREDPGMHPSCSVPNFLLRGVHARKHALTDIVQICPTGGSW